MSEELARAFHDAYERLAPDFGYETRDDTKQFDPESPNGLLMMAVVKEVMKPVSYDEFVRRYPVYQRDNLALRLSEIERMCITEASEMWHDGYHFAKRILGALQP